MSTLNVDKVDPSTGTALELGTSGDTVTVPTGAGLTVVDEVKTNKVSPATGTAFALGDSGDTFTVPSGATIVNSGTATGFGESLRPNAQPYMINGNFGIWQRGTSFTTSVYTADRWKQDLSGATATVTREAHTVGQTDVPGNPKYYLKQNVTTGNDNCGMLYKIEDVDTVIGTFTLSFYAKGVNPAGGNLDIVIQQNFGSGGSTTVELTEQDLTLTASWQQFVFTGTLASISGKTVGTSSYIQIIIKQPSDDANTAAWNLQISQVQLEAGTYTSSTIPPFQHESYGENLRRCLRYYQANYAENNYSELAFSGQSYSANNAQFNSMFLVPMRVEASLGTSGTASHYAVWEAARQTASALPTVGTHSTNVGRGAGVNADIINMRVDMQSTGNLTAGRAASLCANNNNNAVLKYDAEL